MEHQRDLFAEDDGPDEDPDLAEATRRRDNGHAKVIAHDEETFARHWRVALAQVAHRLPEFTSDEVHAALPREAPEPHHVNLIGALMRAAASHGLIRPTGRFRKSRRPSGHRRNVAIWESLVGGRGT